MMSRSLLVLAALCLVSGCMNTRPDDVGLLAAPPEEAPEPFSLVSGAGLDEAAITRLLGSRVEIPDDASIAVLHIPTGSRSYGYRYYGVTEQETSAREAYLDTLRTRLLPSRVREVEVLPSLLVPAELSVPSLREVAVRLQADALLVFRVSSDLYRNYRVFRSDQIRAYATCEAFLLDVRTGAIPFTTVVTREYETERQNGDLTEADAQRRAEQQAVLLALGAMGQDAAVFLRDR